MDRKSSLLALRRDMASLGVAPSAGQWAEVHPQLAVLFFERDALIDRQTDIAERWLFVADGVAASRQTHLDGETSIGRFFEKGQLCANMTSAWNQHYAADDLLAMTDLWVVAIPNGFFRSELLDGELTGRYLRLKSMETLCFDKELIAVKTRIDTESRYRFLELFYDGVLDRVRQRDIAAFLGITPQGLSRFKRRRASLNKG